MSAAAGQQWGGSQCWWQHHHTDGSYLVRDKGKGHGQLPVRGTATWSSHTRCLTHTSTVEASLCFPSTAALRPACPESQDWTSFHTWDTQRQTDKQAKGWQIIKLRRNLKGLPPTWTFCLSSDITEKKTDRGKQISEPIALQVLVSYLQLQAQWRMNTVRPRLCRGRQELYCRWSDFLFCLSDDKPPWRAFTTLGG